MCLLGNLLCFFCVFLSVLLQMEILLLLWSELFHFSYLTLPPRSQITDLVGFIVLNIYVFSSLSVLFPVQAKLPKRLHMYLTVLYNKIYQVKSVVRFSKARQLWSLVLGYWCFQSGSLLVQRTEGAEPAGAAGRSERSSGAWGSALGAAFSLAEYCRLTDGQKFPCVSWESFLSAT